MDSTKVEPIEEEKSNEDIQPSAAILEEEQQQAVPEETNGSIPDGFSPVPSLPMVYKWMVSSIGESMAQAMPMSVRVSMPLDSIRSIAQGISLRNPQQSDELWKNLWITAHTRHFHGVIVLGWARMQQNDSCNPECCPKMIVGKTEVRWKQSPEELASYEDGDPYKVTYLSLPASEYIDRALAENHGILSESSITPFVGGQAQPGVSDYEFSFSPYFIPTMKEVYKYIMRVYTHLYLYHVDLLPQTFSNFLAPPLAPGVLPAAQKELEKFSFHMAYFLNFGLSFHLITHEQIDSLGNAMKYFIWNLPDMEDQVPLSFKQIMANGGVMPDSQQGYGTLSAPNSPGRRQAGSPIPVSPPAGASSNPLMGSSNAGAAYSNQFGGQGQSQSLPPMMTNMMPQQGMMMNPFMMSPTGMSPEQQAQMQQMMMMNPMFNPMMMNPMMMSPMMNPQMDEIRKLQEEVERLRLAASPQAKAPPPPATLVVPTPVVATNSATNSPAAAGKTVSNIDPQLIALKRAELIKKAIAPFIAHNLAIAKVEQDLKESKFPDNYVPSPGYGPNGYLLSTQRPRVSVSASSSSTSSKTFHDDSPKLHPSTRQQMKGDDSDEEAARRKLKQQHNSKKGSGDETSKGEESGSESSSDSSDEEHDSPQSSKNNASHSRPDASALGGASSSKNNDQGDGKKPIPRRPIPQKQAPREPSCGQRLCF